MTLPDIDVVGDTAVLRFTGESPISKAAARITDALIFARDHKLRKLLVVATQVTLVGERSMAATYFRVQEWARASEGFVRLAMVIPPDMIDPRRTGRTMAANSGLVGEVFTSEAEALEWLGRGQGAQNPVRKTPPSN